MKSHAGHLAELEVHAGLLETLHILLHRDRHQAVGWNRDRRHAARLHARIENRHIDAAFAQEARRRKAAGPRANDGHLARTRRAHLDGRVLARLHDEPLHFADRQRMVVVHAGARQFASMVARAAERCAHHVVAPHNLRRFVELAVLHRLHVGRHILVDRADVHAGSLHAIEQSQRTRGLGGDPLIGVAQVQRAPLHRLRVLQQVRQRRRLRGAIPSPAPWR